MISYSGRQPLASIRRLIAVGVLAGMLVVVGLGGFAASTKLSGAIVASGFVVVETNVKKVQHPTGGIVGQLLVKEGNPVQAGDLLIRLDETLTRANLAIVSNSLDELAVRQARLEAERDGHDSLATPAELRDRADHPDTRRMIAAEQKLFELRRTARLGQKSQLKERIAQLRDEGQGLTQQGAAKRREIELIAVELEAVRELWRKNLVPVSRMTVVEREAVRLGGEVGNIQAAAAQVSGKITEIELQIIQLDQDLRSEVARELRDIQAKTAELAERRVAAEDQLRRTEIRAPYPGVVHELKIHTVGGVIGAGEPILLIVPAVDALVIEVKVSPQDVDRATIGQSAVVRFSSFNLGATPELRGTVSHVSPDLVTDPRTGLQYFVARIALPESELAQLGDLTLTPGMPVEAFIETGARSILSYLVKPLHDQAIRAFRER